MLTLLNHIFNWRKLFQEIDPVYKILSHPPYFSFESDFMSDSQFNL